MESSKGPSRAPLKREHSRGKKSRVLGWAERSSALGVMEAFGAGSCRPHIVSPCHGFVDADHLLVVGQFRVAGSPEGTPQLSPARKPGSSTRADFARVGVVEALGKRIHAGIGNPARNRGPQHAPPLRMLGW
jgi:hypothetical protein